MVKKSYQYSMSLAELKEQVAVLSQKERLQLAAYLADLEEQDELAFQKEVDKRMKAMDSGKKVTSQEVEAMHEQLRSQGR